MEKKEIQKDLIEKPRKDFVSKRSVNITTSIPFNIWEEIKASKTSWNSLILRGWSSSKGFDEITQRLRDTEKTSINQARMIQKYQGMVFELNDRIEDLEKKAEK